MSFDEKLDALVAEGRAKLGDLQKEHSAALVAAAQKHQEDIETMKRSYREEVFQIRDRYDALLSSTLKDMATKAGAIAVGVATVVLLAVVTFLYSGMKDAFSGMKDVNQAVMQLQQSLASAYNQIRAATTELETVKKTAAETTSAATKSTEAAIVALTKTQADLEIASKKLADTQKAFEDRLQALRPPGSR
jgi:multidrug efflux pump subunit AcrB